VRVVGGTLRGRPLSTPKTDAIRPTTDRTREAVFNVIAHRYGDLLGGGRVLDLFAGTGALGLEALSRGASYGVFIEESAEGRGLIRTNVEAFGLSGRTKIFRRDATRLGEAGTLQPFDIIFADPPYAKGLGEKALTAALEGGWLKPGALCIVEESAATPFQPPAGFTLEDRRDYGDTSVAFCVSA
jgi:16S rRNA (guanine966-N2)-methyltransferase